MKSYEEMTETVIAHANAQRQIRKHRRSILLASVACLCCVSVAVLGLTRLSLPKPQNPEQVLDRKPKTRFVLTCSASQVAPAELIKDMIVPYQCLIRVRDVTGLNEQQWQTAWNEANATAKDVWECSEADDSATHFGSDTAIISVISDGRLELVVDDLSTVEHMDVTATEMGEANLGTAVYDTGSDRIVIYWSPSDSAIAQIEENPGIKLSALSHTLTVAVDFKDGTKETAVIEMIVDDDGYVYAVQRGITVTA